MKYNYFFLFFFCALRTNAQNYLISFAGAGEINTVSSVKVDNLTNGESLTLDGTYTLQLTETTGIFQVDSEISPGIKIYPNPMIDNSTVVISPPIAGDAVITICEMTGKLVTQIYVYLEKSAQEFRLSGINTGFYQISVTGKTYQFTGKLLCNVKADGTIRLEKISNNNATKEKTAKSYYKGTPASINMEYTKGDRLKFTGISGSFSTVLTDIPTQDKTITFYFFTCMDGDGNNYPVVQIGTQLWMAENLKTTRYSNNSDIPHVEDISIWSTLTSDAFCWYNNDKTNFGSTYGALYNWYAVSNSSLCPTGWHVPVGWHVPADIEWTTLTTYLGGENLAGDKLKETGNSHWIQQEGATNETGFTSLPGGIRLYDGTFGQIGNIGSWWSASEVDATMAWSREMYGSGNVNRLSRSKKYGFSVRCIKNN
jgi:uncharacterized protein (TIGR02145 family)